MPLPLAAMAFGGAAALQVSQGVSSYFAGQHAAKLQEQAAEFQKTLGNQRADQLEIQSGQALARSHRRLSNIRREERNVQSAFRSRAAGANIASDSPSAVNLQGDLATQYELKALTEEASGKNQAKGLDFAATMARAGARAEAERLMQTAGLQRAQSQQALMQGLTSAGFTGLAGAQSGAFTPPKGGFFQGGTIGTQTAGVSPMFAKYGG